MAERLFPILYLELNAVGLTILLIVLFSRQRMGHGSADQRFFSALALSDAAMLALDTAMWLLDGQFFPFARQLLMLASAAYYLLTPLVAYFWLRYCDFHIYQDFDRLRRRRALYLLPFAQMCIRDRPTAACCPTARAAFSSPRANTSPSTRTATPSPRPCGASTRMARPRTRG